MIDIREIWKNQSTVSSGELILKSKIKDIAGLNCYIGTICMSQVKLFILELNKNTNVHENYLKRFVGVEIQVLPGGDHSELVIILLENNLIDIFSYFIEDIINSIITEIDENKALIKISNKIIYWKRLFSKITGELLTPQQQRGLYGELYFLNELLENSNDIYYIVNGWHGPEGANQDFWYNGTGVEIKTSKSNKPTIKISNEYQLDKSGFNDLFLVFYRLNDYQGGSDTLYNIINNIRKKLNSTSLIAFNEKLESLGINTETEEEYTDLSFNVNSVKSYLVSEEFPKIIRDKLPEAISCVSYDIEPCLCDKYETDIDNIINQITNGIN